MNTIQERMDKALEQWSEQDALVGLSEGWVLSTTSGAVEMIQCQKIDSPEDHLEDTGFLPPTLESDAAAWQLLHCGVTPSHEKAREILRLHSPIEWAAIVESVAPQMAAN